MELKSASEYTKDYLKMLSTQELLELQALVNQKVEDDHLSQLTDKILINSLYGALGNKHFLLANPDLAAAITACGRFFIRLLSDNLESNLQSLLPYNERYTLYNDTDSVYYTIDPFVVKKFGKDVNRKTTEVVDWIDNFEKKIIQPIIQNTINEFAEILNIYDPTMVGVEREIIADVAVLISKKRYFARVLDAEGVRYDLDHPYIKIMGVEIIRSSTPPWVKDRLTESIQVILDSTESDLRRWRDKVKAQFMEQDIMDISMTASISSLDYNLGDKGVPQGAKSALAHNAWVEQNDLESSIPTLKPGEKYKRCYLKTPNIFNTDVISFESDAIADIIKDQGIYDYQLNFEKYFEGPLSNMIETLGWNVDNVPQFDEW